MSKHSSVRAECSGERLYDYIWMILDECSVVHFILPMVDERIETPVEDIIVSRNVRHLNQRYDTPERELLRYWNDEMMRNLGRDQ